MAAKKLVGTNLEWVEECVFTCAIRDYRFWSKFCYNRLNQVQNAKQGYRRADFTKPIANAIYNAIDEYYQGFADAPGEMTKEIAINLTAKLQKSNLVTPDELVECLRLVNETWKVPLASLKGFAEIAFPYWLDRKRTLQLAGTVASKPTLTSEDVMQRLREISDATKVSEKEPTPSLLTFVEQEKPDVLDFIPLPSLGDFNYPLGGGLIRGELGLVITPPNGGKTVLANQIARDLSITGNKVILLTTEQRAQAMYVRQISATCDIPFSKISRGLDMKALGEKERALVKKFAKRVDPFLRIEDWSNSPSTLNVSLPTLFEELADKGELPAVFIIDWLGGGMENVPEEKLRNYMISTTKNIKRLGAQYNMSTVLFAQANAEQVAKVKFVNHTHADSCKMLHTYADWGLGISALSAQEQTGKLEESETTHKASYQRLQTFNFFKTRNAPQNAYTFERDFGFQRWKPVSASINSFSAANVLRNEKS